jgi:hypothetical protein
MLFCLKPSRVLGWILTTTAWLTFAQTAPPGEVFLDSPVDFQVFQRASKETGDIRVAGWAQIECDAAEARTTGASAFGRLTGQWQPLSFEHQSDAFHGDLSVQLAAGMGSNCACCGWMAPSQRPAARSAGWQQEWQLHSRVRRCNL